MKAHRTDLVSFAFGLLFLALSAWWLLAQVLGLVLPPVGWFLAGGLILVGALGLIGALRSSRHGNTAAPTGPSSPEPAGPGSTATGSATAGSADPGEAGSADPASAEPTEPGVSWLDTDGEPARPWAETSADRTLDLPVDDGAAPPQPRGPAA
ncbi:hypothetical protein [Micromonospora radicis]|uniref:Uncharacterized protein n=1 Tax=Micromonospora radicis TaxID=1894971 RepID=A0A418MV68_9ACTN|nr:hypothetical protein D2L64_11595 [Micromonospora radicis]